MSNIQIGFKYWSAETKRYNDPKIKRLKRHLGGIGIAIHDFILNEIYREKGYYIIWDDDQLLDVAEYFNEKENLITEVVNYCCAVGLFDKELLKSESILTSEAIQIRFVDWSYIMKREGGDKKKIILRIKEKYSKLPEKYSKLLEVSSQPSGSLPTLNLTKPNLTKPKVSLSIEERQRLFQFFVFEKNVREPYLELDRFISHYQSVGWIDKNGNKIIDKLSKAKQWGTQKPGLRCDVELLNKWKEVFNLVYKASGEVAFTLLHFTPKIVDGNLILQFQKYRSTDLKKAIDILDNQLGQSLFYALRTVFKDGFDKLKYEMFKSGVYVNNE